MASAGRRGRYRKRPIRFVSAARAALVQVKRITKAERLAGKIKNEDRPGADRDHAMFVAYAPWKRHAMPYRWWSSMAAAGSSMAAPIAKDILAETLRLDPARVASTTLVPGEES